MSGIANAASTMPGRVATFWSCSRERSVRIASRSSSSANTRAGTRMSARAPAGISQSASSIRRRLPSDVKDDPRAPPIAFLPHVEPMVGHRLDEVWWGGEAADHGPLETRFRKIEALGPLRDQTLGLDQVDKLGQPFGQEGRPIGGRDCDLEGRRRPTAVYLGALGEQLAECCHGLLEHRALARGLDLQLELSGVVHPAVHGSYCRSCRLSPRL